MVIASTKGDADTAAPHSKKPLGRYTARLLIRLPICAVPPLSDQSTNPIMVASKRNNIEVLG
jgi:hypothetical protein